MPFFSLQRHHGRPGGPAPAAIAADHRPPPGGSEYEKAENGRNKPVDGEQEQDGRCVMHTDPERGYRAAWVLLRAAALRALWRAAGGSILKLKFNPSASCSPAGRGRPCCKHPDDLHHHPARITWAVFFADRDHLSPPAAYRAWGWSKSAYNALTTREGKEKGSHDLCRNSLFFLARLERFELPTYGFVVRQK